MAQDISDSVLVVVFPSRKILIRALEHLNQLDNILINRAAIVAKAKDGETIILDDDLSPDEGGVAGGTLGAAMTAFGLVQLGALALPGVGPIIAIGAGVLAGGLLGRMTGRFAADFLDFGFRNEQIENLADELTAGHPALVLEIPSIKDSLSLLREELAPYQAELIAPLHRTGRLSLSKAVEA